MSDPYPILEVKPEWFVRQEEMGSKKKFWYRPPPTKQVATLEENWKTYFFNPPLQERGRAWLEIISASFGRSQGNPLAKQGSNWLFKYPVKDKGQHWAEKIAAEIAKLLGIPRAKVELAEFSGKQGSATESFVRVGQELVHGNQLLEGVVYGYDPLKKYHQSGHTLSNIWQVLDTVFSESEAANSAKHRIAEYLILDALIGNTDRHHENWGVLLKRDRESWRGFVAPSFDHASSLGRELLDEDREKRLVENQVRNYADKGRGAIYWSDGEQKAPNQRDLVRQATLQQPYQDFFSAALMKIEKLDKKSISDIVNRVPHDWMTLLAREFAIALMCYNYERLQELCHER